MNPTEIIARVETMLRAYLEEGGDDVDGLLDEDVTAGKFYEAWVLAVVAEHLAVEEHLRLRLSTGTEVMLKSSPGPINRSYPHIEVFRSDEHVADLWTDVEFTAFSCASTGAAPSEPGHYHELDIVLVEPDCDSRPRPEQLWLGVECKHRKYNKALLRELLGVRRELGLLSAEQSTRFKVWPRGSIPAIPPVCLLAYSSDPSILRFKGPGMKFGIDFFHEPLTSR